MERYCFAVIQASTNEGVIKARRLFKDIRVEMTISKESDICVSLLDKNDADYYEAAIKEVAKDNYAFSVPVFVPEWRTISNNNGVYSPDKDAVERLKDVSIASKSDRSVKYNPPAEILPAFVAYARLLTSVPNIDEVTKQNFWKSLTDRYADVKRVFAKGITDIDITDLIRALSVWDGTDKSYIRDRYGSVTVDGVDIPLINYSILPTRVRYNRNFTGDIYRGTINWGVKLSDVELNLNTVPSTWWSARWTDQNLLKQYQYTTINFESVYPKNEPTREPESESESESEEGESSEEIDYPEEGEEGGAVGGEGESEGGAVGGEGESEGEDDNDKPTAGQRRKGVKSGAFDEDEEYVIDFDELETDEWLLPIGMLLPDKYEWDAVRKALSSNFSVVKDLKWVKNKTIRLVADACELALERGTISDEKKRRSVVAFIDYASQRG